MKNVFGETLKSCCTNPITGYFRDGFCRTDESDFGKHTVCAIVDDKFLQFSKLKGNDLSTPNPGFQFMGLKPGDQWCLCASRCLQAYVEGCAPKVNLSSTHKKALVLEALETLNKWYDE